MRDVIMNTVFMLGFIFIFYSSILIKKIGRNTSRKSSWSNPKKNPKKNTKKIRKKIEKIRKKNPKINQNGFKYII